MGRKVVIIDDHKSVGEGYKRWLELDGYDVTILSSIDKNFFQKIVKVINLDSI